MPNDRDLARELEESEAIQRGILAAVPAGVTHVLADGTFRLANAEALRILGIGASDAPKLSLDLIAPRAIREDGSPCPVSEFVATKALTTGEPAGPKTVGVRQSDGSIVWCVFRAVPVKQQGAVTGAVIGFLDVTSQIAVAQTLRDSEAKLAAVMVNAPNVIFTLTPEGRFTFMNHTVPSVEAIVDTTSIVGQNFLDWLNPRDQEMVRAKLKAVVERGENVQYEVEGLDGIDPNSYMANLGPVWRDGKVVEIAGIISVITDLRRAESERIRLVEELHEAQRLEGLGRLAGGVAHDFNNLLTIVQANVDLLLSPRHGHGLEASSEIQERIREIGDAARRAATLTRQLLAFGRKQELVPRTLDLKRLVEGIAPLLRRLLAEHTKLDIHAEPGLGSVHADPVELERVLVNLVMNASDAMPDGGTIRVLLSNEDGGTGGGKQVMLAVEDTGVGMSPDVAAHAFEPFFTTKAPGRGTGLGLATVHGIVRQSAGSVEIDTHVGAGTTVRVLLPRASGVAAPPAPTDVPRSTEARRSTILLVEDDPAVREVTKLLLESNGYEVIAPVSPLAAATLAGDVLARVELLLTDVVMPEISGTTLATRLRERSPELPVLLMSGHVRDGEPPLRGSYYFIPKPFDETTLVGAVRQAIGSGRATVAASR